MRSLGLLLITTIMILTITACGSSSSSGGSADIPSADQLPYNPTINPSSFSTVIDNPYWPLKSGTKFVYSGKTEDGLEVIELKVTSRTRTVMGVKCLVIRETAWEDGELVEDTYDWFAQDDAGNVWYFGEDSKEYEDGRVVSTSGSWEAGINGAQPGVVMLDDPRVGQTYRQEYYAGEAEDKAKVISTSATVDVAYGKYGDVLKTLEWTPLEPGVQEHKYYVPGIGLVLEENAHTKDRIELVDIIKGSS